jgi:GNAT superfamily N-acetyltransferase
VRRYGRVEPLTAQHDVSAFDCGSDAQTDWLHRYGHQAQASDTSKVYVVCLSESRAVAGYYALAAGSVSHDVATPRVAKGIGRYPVPVVILTRLGVDTKEQGRGLGSALLRDALLQTAMIAEHVGVRALLVHAESTDAARFYQRFNPAFEPSPTDELHLIILMKDLRAAIRDATTRPVG